MAILQARSQGFLAVPMPLGCRRIPGPGGGKLIQIKTYFDFILIKDPKCLFIDFKSFDNHHIIFSYLTEHQVDVLSDIEEKGPSVTRAGYVVHLRSLQQVYFFSGLLLTKLERRQAIEAKDGLCLGPYDKIDFNKLL